MRMVPQAREALQASVAGGSVSALREPESRQVTGRRRSHSHASRPARAAAAGGAGAGADRRGASQRGRGASQRRSGLEWSSDKHLPTSDELLELSKEQQEAILGGSGDLSFNMSPWIRALVSIVYDFNEGLPEYCAEQVLVLSNCVPAEFQQTLQHQTTKQGTSRREFICSLQKTTPVTNKPVLLKFRGKRVEEEVLSSQSKLLGIGYSLLQSALDAWAVAAGHDSKFWEASDVFLMIANCQAIKREQSLRKDARFPDSKFRILRKLADGKEVLAFRVVPTAARQFDNPTIIQYYNGNSVKLHRAVVQSQSSHNPQQQPAKRQRHVFPRSHGLVCLLGAPAGTFWTGARPSLSELGSSRDCLEWDTPLLKNGSEQLKGREVMAQGRG